MTLVNYPGSDHQMAQISIDAGYARDIMLMLTDAHAVIAGLAGGEAPAAARQGAAVLRDADGAAGGFFSFHLRGEMKRKGTPGRCPQEGTADDQPPRRQRRRPRPRDL